MSEPPEAAIFTTLENQSFYSRHHYKPLDLKGRNIRLLKVHPERMHIEDLPEAFPRWFASQNDTLDLMREGINTKCSFICCEVIEQVPLESITNKYAAPSYCGGAVTDTRRIMIDGYWFNALLIWSIR